MTQPSKLADASSRLCHISHDFHAPLANIVGLTEILYEEHEGQIGEYKASNHRNTQMLMNTVSSVLDFAYVQSDLSKLALDRVD